MNFFFLTYFRKIPFNFPSGLFQNNALYRIDPLCFFFLRWVLSHCTDWYTLVARSFTWCYRLIAATYYSCALKYRKYRNSGPLSHWKISKTWDPMYQIVVNHWSLLNVETLRTSIMSCKSWRQILRALTRYSWHFFRMNKYSWSLM